MLQVYHNFIVYAIFAYATNLRYALFVAYATVLFAIDGGDSLAALQDLQREGKIRHIGGSIAKREKCTLSKTEGCADLLIWLPRRIEEKGFEVRKISPREILSGER
jgi:hypothetical protein